jgi:hypothetical protein
MEQPLPTAGIPETGKSHQLRGLNGLGSASSQNCPLARSQETRLSHLQNWKDYANVLSKAGKNSRG